MRKKRGDEIERERVEGNKKLLISSTGKNINNYDEIAVKCKLIKTFPS